MNRLLSGLFCVFSCIVAYPTSAQDVSHSATSAQVDPALSDTSGRHWTQEQLRAAARTARLQGEQSALSRTSRSRAKTGQQTPPSPNAVDNRVQNQVGEAPSHPGSGPHSSTSIAMEILHAQEALGARERLPASRVPESIETTLRRTGDLSVSGRKTLGADTDPFAKRSANGKKEPFALSAHARAVHRASILESDVSVRDAMGAKFGDRFTALDQPGMPSDLASVQRRVPEDLPLLAAKKQSRPGFSGTTGVSSGFKGKMASRLEHLRAGVSLPHPPSQDMVSYRGSVEGLPGTATANRATALPSIAYSGLGEGVYGSRISQSTSYHGLEQKKSSLSALQDLDTNDSLLTDTTLLQRRRSGKMPGMENRDVNRHMVSGHRHTTTESSGASGLRSRLSHNNSTTERGSHTRREAQTIHTP